MGVVETSKIYRLGDKSNPSRLVRLPRSLKIGEKATMAGDRLLLLDPRGEIAPELLLDFFEKEVEYRFWKWMEERGKNKNEVCSSQG